MNPCIYVSLAIILLVLSYQDIKEHMIYDWIPQFGVVLGVGINHFIGNSFELYLLDAFIAFLGIFIIHFLYQKLKKVDGIGLGDAYVFACIGAFLGFQSLYPVLLSACIFALLFMLIAKAVCQKNVSCIPFVPFLSLGTLTFFLMELI